MRELDILTRFEDVEPYLPSVVDAADSHRNELGFIVRSAYADQAQQDKLWVASRNGKYVGHLLFGGRYPRVRIFQIFALPSERGSGVGRMLIERLKTASQERGCLSISANVASDLDDANEFWSKQGFRAVLQQLGGATTGRKIIVREFAIQGTSLFSLDKAGSTLKALQPKDRSSLNDVPSVALDLNVIFDLTNKRPRTEEAAAVLRQGMTGKLNLYVTAELVEELQRYSASFPNDPFLSFAIKLPTLPQAVSSPALLTQLRQIVFPNRRLDRKRADQDQSDLKHLAAAIQHRLNGFVTSEKAILQKAAQIFEQTGLNISSPADFIIEPGEASVPENWDSQSGSFQIVEVKGAWESACVTFAARSGCEQGDINTVLISGNVQEPRRRFCLLDAGTVYALATWSIAAPSLAAIAYIIVNEDHRGAVPFLNAMLETFLRESATAVGRDVRLCINVNQEVTQEVALRFGFAPDNSRPAGSFEFFRKIAFKGLVTPGNWLQFATSANRLLDSAIPNEMPGYGRACRDGLNILKRKDKIDFVALRDFEAYFRPVLFLFPDRTGAMLPIKSTFAEDLLGTVHRQMSLLPGHETSFKPTRAYFRSPQQSQVITEGMPLIFYASGDIGAAIGCAHVLQSSVCNVAQIEWEMVSQGVLTKQQLVESADKEGNVHVIVFDGFQPFRNRVPRKTLINIGTGKANFVTVEKLAPEILKEICCKGMTDA